MPGSVASGTHCIILPVYVSKHDVLEKYTDNNRKHL